MRIVGITYNDEIKKPVEKPVEKPAEKPADKKPVIKCGK